MFSLYMRAALLAFETQQVMALRMMRLAGGGAVAQREFTRMMTEKGFAAAQAATAASFSLAAGKSGEQVAAGALKGYSSRVRRNRRRLTGR